MVKGAIHPNGSNFRRAARLDVVARVRRLCETKLLEQRPKWLEWCERVPPIENHSLNLQARTIRSPYPQMVRFLLNKYPDLRFQDCYVDGNDWSAGNDSYRADHPVMQFVARQLELMRSEGLSKKDAFIRTEALFRHRREHLEREQKVMMALALDAGLAPMFATGKAFLEAEKCKGEAAHLNNIRRQLREMREEATPYKPGDAVLFRDRQEGASHGSFRRGRVESVEGGSVVVAFPDGPSRPVRADSPELQRDRVALQRARVSKERARMAELDQERATLVNSSIFAREPVRAKIEDLPPDERAATSDPGEEKEEKKEGEDTGDEGAKMRGESEAPLEPGTRAPSDAPKPEAGLEDEIYRTGRRVVATSPARKKATDLSPWMLSTLENDAQGERDGERRAQERAGAEEEQDDWKPGSAATLRKRQHTPRADDDAEDEGTGGGRHGGP